MRKTICAAVPEAEEVISYQIPAYKLNGKILVYFAGFNRHIGLYPPVTKSLSKETTKYAGPKGNLRFPLTEPIPWGLVRKIARLRAKEILAASQPR